MAAVIIFGAFILLALVVGVILDKSRAPAPKQKPPSAPSTSDEALLNGYLLGTILAPPDAQQLNPDSPHASSPTPPASEIHHPFPDHSPSIDTSSHSHDSGSFDSGSTHSGH